MAEGGRPHPYRIKLQALVDTEFGKNKVRINEWGKSGALIAEITTMINDCKAGKIPLPGQSFWGLQFQQSPPCPNTTARADLLVLLAGTNDLGRFEGDTIAVGDKMVRDLNELVTSAQGFLRPPGFAQAVDRTYVLTLPDAAFKFPAYTGLRTRYNDYIRQRATDPAGPWQTVDLERLIPFVERGNMWSDKLHFSSPGYDRVGELVFSAIRAELKALLVGANGMV